MNVDTESIGQGNSYDHLKIGSGEFGSRSWLLKRTDPAFESIRGNELCERLLRSMTVVTEVSWKTSKWAGSSGRVFFVCLEEELLMGN
jgi:hypothetical protein